MKNDFESDLFVLSPFQVGCIFSLSLSSLSQIMNIFCALELTAKWQMNWNETQNGNASIKDYESLVILVRWEKLNIAQIYRNFNGKCTEFCFRICMCVCAFCKATFLELVGCQGRFDFSFIHSLARYSFRFDEQRNFILKYYIIML